MLTTLNIHRLGRLHTHRREREREREGEREGGKEMDTLDVTALYRYSKGRWGWCLSRRRGFSCRTSSHDPHPTVDWATSCTYAPERLSWAYLAVKSVLVPFYPCGTNRFFPPLWPTLDNCLLFLFLDRTSSRTSRNDSSPNFFSFSLSYFLLSLNGRKKSRKNTKVKLLRDVEIPKKKHQPNTTTRGSCCRLSIRTRRDSRAATADTTF